MRVPEMRKQSQELRTNKESRAEKIREQMLPNTASLPRGVAQQPRPSDESRFLVTPANRFHSRHTVSVAYSLQLSNRSGRLPSVHVPFAASSTIRSGP